MCNCAHKNFHTALTRAAVTRWRPRSRYVPLREVPEVSHAQTPDPGKCTHGPFLYVAVTRSPQGCGDGRDHSPVFSSLPSTPTGVGSSFWTPTAPITPWEPPLSPPCSRGRGHPARPLITGQHMPLRPRQTPPTHGEDALSHLQRTVARRQGVAGQDNRACGTVTRNPLSMTVQESLSLFFFRDMIKTPHLVAQLCCAPDRGSLGIFTCMFVSLCILP